MTATAVTPSTPAGETTAARHKVWKLGDDIDTDVLAPGAYMKLGIEGIAPHCLESVRPEFAAAVRPGDVVVAGANFGIGSSREQAAGALVHLGVRAVIAGELRDGELVTLDLQALMVMSGDGVVLPCAPIPDFLLDMVAAGGLLNQLRLRLGSGGVKPA